MNFRALFVSLLFASFLSADSITISCNDHPLFDSPLAIEISGLQPSQVVMVEASWIDASQVQWASEAVFQANSAGRVEIARQAPITGSYTGVDPMGLFWSMQTKNVIPYVSGENEEGDCGKYCFANVIKVYDGRHLIAEKTICRCLHDERVESMFLEEDGLVGKLFLPESDQPRPVVIVLTGSNGGMQTQTAALIASHGIPALALAYTGAGDLPEVVEDVPLEYFESAFEWVGRHPKLSGEIYLHGTSRGGELALILGSYYPDKIHKIVAIAPSSVVLSADSWLKEDEPILPAAPYFVDLNNDLFTFDNTKDSPRSIRIHRERALYLERDRFDAAAIPVEQIRCPVLLISGGDDQLGPCSIYSELILERLEAFGSKIRCEHLDYPQAGHLISEPYFPRKTVYCVDGQWINFGGDPRADEIASRESWQKTLEFFSSP